MNKERLERLEEKIDKLNGLLERIYFKKPAKKKKGDAFSESVKTRLAKRTVRNAYTR